MPVFLTASYIILVALYNESFYVSRPNDVSHAYVSFSTSNISRRYSWYSLQPFSPNGVAVFHRKFEKNVLYNNTGTLYYKLRFIFHNHTHGDTQWRNITLHAKKNILTIDGDKNDNVTTNFILLVVILIINALILIKHMIDYCKPYYVFLK